MTREQALNEPLPWLKFLFEVCAEERAEAALFQLQAVYGGTAPGSLKKGDKVFEQIRSTLERQAGIA